MRLRLVGLKRKNLKRATKCLWPTRSHEPTPGPRNTLLGELQQRPVFLVLDAAQQQPLVLVVENLHWSDPTSEAWLASLVERLAGAAVLLLGTYRPGYQPAWGRHAAVTQVAVPPVRAPDSRAVVQAVLGAVSLPEARLRTMVAQAGGNPFFLEELAWHAAEQGGRDARGRCPRPCTPCWRRAWTGCRRRRSDSSKRLPLLAPRCPCHFCRPLRSCPRRCCTAA